ncbi:MAG TPA: hypothetical protein VD866_29265 [Urbifossiella sp.]|nr:hypothetical protein [Urbifossiella sp.]
MDAPALVLLAAAAAGLLVYCDLDAVFDAPPTALGRGPWVRLMAWWWGFVLANGALAGFLFSVLRDKPFLADLNPWLAALLTGAGYTALIRLQFTTLPGNIPFGLETLYQGVRNVVHRRINLVIRDWRVAESKTLAQTPLADLRERALLMVGSDALLNDAERAATERWITDRAADTTIAEGDRRRTLALYIITGRR